MHAIAVPAKPAALLGLIVNEVATNAIKHGFTSESERRFTVTLHQDPRSGTVRLTMENTGNPVPNGIELGNATTAGLRLIEALVDQLDGKIELEKCPQARFTIWFPVSAGQSSR
jgi:two-component sensor histidine kinase